MEAFYPTSSSLLGLTSLTPARLPPPHPTRLRPGHHPTRNLLRPPHDRMSRSPPGFSGPSSQGHSRATRAHVGPIVACSQPRRLVQQAAVDILAPVSPFISDPEPDAFGQLMPSQPEAGTAGIGLQPEGGPPFSVGIRLPSHLPRSLSPAFLTSSLRPLPALYSLSLCASPLPVIMLAPPLCVAFLALASTVAIAAPTPLDGQTDSVQLEARQNTAGTTALSTAAKADLAVFADLTRLVDRSRREGRPDQMPNGG